MTLDELHILEEYRTGEQDLVESFYKPCLSEATTYDRAVGYFRSTVFLLIGSDLIEFAKRGGTMRLVCSPNLTDEDYNAIASGFQSRDSALDTALVRDFESLCRDKSLRTNAEALATLISVGVISLKIAFRPEGHGIYHEKMGSSEFSMGKSQTMVKNVVQESFFMEIFK